MQLDVRGPRFAAAVTTLVLIAVLVTGNGWLALAQTVVFALGAVSARHAPYGVLFRTLRRAAPRPPTSVRARRTGPIRAGRRLRVPRRRHVGVPRGATVVGLVATGFALVAAFLNAAFGLCLGCEAYLLSVAAPAAHRDAVTPQHQRSAERLGPKPASTAPARGAVSMAWSCDFERCYRAVDSRDARFDGWFFTAVTSTGIYCRPSCPAITPKRANVRFLPVGGGRAARRVPGLPALPARTPRPARRSGTYRADVVGRAMRLIADGVVDRDGVPGLAARLGYTERHLHRMLTAEVGAGPLALARAQRAQTARILIETTGLGLAEIAFAAGFGSVRQFNDTIREVYGARAVRAARRRRRGAGDGRARRRSTLRLPYRRAAARRGAARVPRRPHDPRRRRGRRRHVPPRRCACRTAPATVGADAPARVRRGDAAPGRRARPGAGGGPLPPAARPGRRPGGRRRRAGRRPGAGRRRWRRSPAYGCPARSTASRWRSGRSSASRSRWPAPARSSPASSPPPARHRRTAWTRDAARRSRAPTEVAEAPDEAFGDAGRAAARRCAALAAAVADGELRPRPGRRPRPRPRRRLVELPGIGPWTAGYVAMRALGDPDVLLPTDLGVRRGAAALGLPDDPTALAAHADALGALALVRD